MNLRGVIRACRVHPGTILVGILSLLLLCSLSQGQAAEVNGAAEEAAKAAQTFDSVYGADLKRVRSTRDAKDDIELAGKLLAAARQVEGQPAFLTVLCQKAYDLACVSPEGYKTAIESMEMLTTRVPEKAGESAEAIVQIRQKQFDGSKGSERFSAGETLVEALLAVANVKAAGGALTDALSACKKASTVARAINTDKNSEVELRLKGLAASMKAAREVESLKKQFAVSPEDAALREKLVRLYLVDLDNPVEASIYVEVVKDYSLVKFVPAAAKPLVGVPEMACLELGDWYRGLGESVPPSARAAMFLRARGYYKRFLETHSQADLERAKVTAALDKLDAELRKLGDKRSSGWMDLLVQVDPPRDARGSKWERQGSGLAMTGNPKGDHLVVIPVVVDGDYELQMSLVRTSGTDTFGCVLPVGTSSVAFVLSWWDGKASGLFPVNGKYLHDDNETAVKPGTVLNNREYNLYFKVLSRDGQAQITVLQDGKPFTSWQGPLSALSSVWRFWPSSWPVPAKCVGLGCTGSNVVFRTVRLRMLSGEATPQRSKTEAQK